MWIRYIFYRNTLIFFHSFDFFLFSLQYLQHLPYSFLLLPHTQFILFHSLSHLKPPPPQLKSPIPFPITFPFLVVIDLQCSLGFVCVFAKNWFPWLSTNYLANCPTCVSKFLIDASVFFWLDREACMNFLKVSPNLDVLSWTEGYCGCCW